MNQDEIVKELFGYLQSLYRTLRKMEVLVVRGTLSGQKVCDGDCRVCRVMETEKERDECPVIH